MPTSYSFTPEQLSAIAAFRTTIADPDHLSRPSGAVPLYSYIFACITGMEFSAQALRTLLATSFDQDLKESAVWLAGAIGVNSDSGAFSNLIREFNVHQGVLRGMGVFTDAQLQRASNEVGINLANSILNATDDQGEVNRIQGKLPTVQEIGASDLNGVRDILYPGNENPGTELYLNQAWPGIVMLGTLGGRYWDRLVRTDEVQPTQMDSLMDLKSVLFCWDAFKPRWPPKFPRVWPPQTPPPELIGNRG